MSSSIVPSQWLDHFHIFPVIFLHPHLLRTTPSPQASSTNKITKGQDTLSVGEGGGAPAWGNVYCTGWWEWDDWRTGREWIGGSAGMGVTIIFPGEVNVSLDPMALGIAGMMQRKWRGTGKTYSTYDQRYCIVSIILSLISVTYPPPHDLQRLLEVVPSYCLCVSLDDLDLSNWISGLIYPQRLPASFGPLPFLYRLPSQSIQEFHCSPEEHTHLLVLVLSLRQLDLIRHCCMPFCKVLCSRRFEGVELSVADRLLRHRPDSDF